MTLSLFSNEIFINLMSYYYTQWIIYVLIIFLAYKTLGTIFAFIALILTSIKILSDIGVFKTLNYKIEKFPASRVWITDYTGNYNQVYNKINKLNEYLKILKIDTNFYSVFGLYHDDPAKSNPNSTRAIIGIIRKKEYDSIEQIIIQDQSINSHLGLMELRIDEFKEMNTVATKLAVFNIISTLIVIAKYYRALPDKLNDKQFVEKFGINLLELPGIIEIYRENIEFFIPILNSGDRVPLNKSLAKEKEKREITRNYYK